MILLSACQRVEEPIFYSAGFPESSNVPIIIEEKIEPSIIVAKEDKGEEKKTAEIDKIGSVPFAAQAPFGNWSDPKQQDGCEEASALMAVAWAREEGLNLTEAETKIIACADYQIENYGTAVDTDVKDSIERIYNGCFSFTKVEARYGISLEDIILEIENGSLVVVPANGQILANPFYTAPGPDRHNLLIIGYDPDTNEFITNDAGTRHGQNFRFPANRVFEAIYDYPTGNHEPILNEQKAMIVISR
jgi:hypothetical protein